MKQKTKPKAASRTAAPKKPAPKKAAAQNPVGKMIDRAFGMVTRALADEDAATNLLTRQHADVKALFEQLEAESARPAKLRSSRSSRETWSLTTPSSGRFSTPRAKRPWA